MTDDLAPREIDTLLSAATAAPSMHNTQPWQFAVSGAVVDVYLDSTRTLPAEDPTGRAMRIAAGAAVFNLRVAAAHLGFDGWDVLAPDPAEPDIAARVVLQRTEEPDPVLACLHAWILRRRTSHLPTTREQPIPAMSRAALMAAATAEGARLTWLPDTAVDQLLGMVVDAELRGVANWERSVEPAHWVGGDRAVPSEALGSRSTSYPPPVRHLATAPHDRTGPHPVLAVLSTRTDRPVDAITAGIALQRILLIAAAGGLSASFLNQPLEYDDLRADTQGLTGHPGGAHMVIRFVPEAYKDE